MRLILLSWLFVSMNACSNSGEEKGMIHAVRQSDQTQLTETQPAEQLHVITVVDVKQVPKYTYILAHEQNQEYWLAAPTTQVKKGDTLYYQGGVMMQQFESKELNRKFDKILFVDKISSSATMMSEKNGNGGLPPGHVPIGTAGKTTTENKTVPVKIDLPANGTAIADILKNPSAFKGKTIVVKGKVTKYTAGVMKKNWVHLQDGTTFNGKSDIVITTSADLALGDIVTFEGLISVNKDLGYGYFFEVLIEDAKKL